MTKAKIQWPFERASCLEWGGARDKDGYGRVEHQSSASTRAHRVFYELFFGKALAADTVLMHRCDNPACFNPHHLTATSQLENVRDMDAKGRRVNASTLVTHCPRGHEYTDANTVIWNDGKRRCRTCETHRRMK